MEPTSFDEYLKAEHAKLNILFLKLAALHVVAFIAGLALAAYFNPTVTL